MEDKNKIIEGRFDGQNMIGDDQNNYPIPANYASKSKLVEGDRLKLTIQEDGSFIFKQIEPIARKRIVATVQAGQMIQAGENSYKILLASSTYFDLKPGDRVVALVPKSGEADWAAIENKTFD